jgi:hypothetical protein
MNGTDNCETAIHDTDDLGGHTSQRRVAASHTSDDGSRSMEPVHTPTLASRNLAPVRQILMADSSGLFGADHHQPALTAQPTADAGPG